ncbi:uncharacterized protein [Macrobrachium rosenbergii]|uniref:uncharacterized protein isoform X2 n=1 Tax=Macrobrachium rosenbergii TaxID=79674 RepID=UPI0034D6AAE0
MSEELILVTGVSGYIASHVAKLLLEDGYRVRGTVRDLSDEGKVAPLKALVPDAKHPIELVEADLTKDDGWDKAVEECTKVVHAASLKGPQEEGAQGEADGRLLKACAATKTVSRVILTSCYNTVLGEAAVDPEKNYNEDDWTDVESPDLDSYTKSKVLAEKAAWDFIKELPDERKMELAVINPGFVLGPPLMESHKGSTSVNYMTQIVNRTYPAVPKLMFPVCDVRDVARAHVQALTLPEAAGKRHIITTDSFWMKDVALAASKEFRPQGYNIPTCQLPYFVVWMAGIFNKTYKNHLLPRLGKVMKVDNKRMVETLGIEPTALDCTVQDMIYAMIDLGIVRKAKKYKQVGSRAEVPPAANGEIEDEKKDKGTEKGGEEQEKEKEQEEEKKELEPEDKEEKDEEIKKDDRQPSEAKEEKKKNNEEQKEESEAEK